jgi:hypothetical protein
VLAWAEGQIDTLALLPACPAAQACFIRAGIGDEVNRSST